MLHYRRDGRHISHYTFSDLPNLLRPGDLLVFNDARVVPARFVLRKSTGGRVEGLFLAETSPGKWRVLLKNLGSAGGRAMEVLTFENAAGLTAKLAASHGAGEYDLEVASEEPAMAILSRIGRMPLPPYIRRGGEGDERDAADRDRYQTVYARSPGAVAAPTAGLHFTEELLAELDRKGIERTFVTLHVGLGTFKPVTAEVLSEHRMHRETYAIGSAAAEALTRAKQDGRRIVAVGTTSAPRAGEPAARRSA